MLAAHLIFFGGKLSAKDYVQRDAKLLIVSAENDGWGQYDATSTRWMNLINGAYAVNSTNLTFSPDGASAAAQIAIIVPQFSLLHHTIEARISRFAGTQQNHGISVTQYMSISGGTTADFGFATQRYPVRTSQYINEIAKSFKTSVIPEEKHTLTASFSYDDGESVIKFYVDGVPVSTQSYTGIITGATGGVYSSFRPNNYLNRLSVYSSVLSDEEIAHNAKVDEAIFGLP